ncbi:MAG: DegV family protein [Firmicutes bacterium]|nr:DegV family protein [Bacillota bacterium]
MSWKITSDSTCDLNPEQLTEYGISLLPLHVTMGDGNYLDGVDVAPADIYAHVDAGGQLPVTAAINPAEYSAFFARFAGDSDFIIHICLSAEFSSCYQNACTAAAEFPNVYVVDSRNLSTGHGHMVLAAAEMAEAGLAATEIVERLQALAPKIDASFILSRLDYLRKGGRCSSLAALGANVLKLRPSILVREGKMTVSKKYRGAFAKCMCEYIRDRLAAGDIDEKRIFITHSGLDQSLLQLAEDTVRSLHEFDEICVTHSGCTISSHCGPGCMGVLFIHK